MSRFDAHVLLVSEQAAPNLLPALDPELKPKSVILFVSSKMERRAAALETVFRENGIKVERQPIADEHDFWRMSEEMLETATRYKNLSIALNLTGGTKLMALVAQSVAVTAGWSMFYVDLDTDEAIWLGKNSSRQRLAQQLRLRHYLKAYGFSTKDIPRPAAEPRHRDLCATLVQNVSAFERPLGQLNWLAQKAEQNGTLEIEMDEAQRDSRGLEALLRNFEDAGVLKVNQGRVVFTNEKERAFANGGWLEDYVYRTVEGLHGVLDIRDKALNLEITDPNGVKNEFDVVFLARNRLFVIECKTSRMNLEQSDKANNALFKLAENCRRVGGLGTRGMFATYRGLEEAEKRLAKALNIEVVAGRDLARLDERLKSWCNVSK
ncbi:MAG: DUF1887 family CARF protein [Methylophilaceae bacterium]|nr:DUF1887 family CARF protein [Methylophilaceae bacterium]